MGTAVRMNFLLGLALDEQFNLARAVFQRVLLDPRLAAFEPAPAGYGEFSAGFFGAQLTDFFYCVLEIEGPLQSSLSVAYHLGGRSVEREKVGSFADVDAFVGGMARRVRRFMRRRAARVSGTIRDRRTEIWDVLANHEALGVVRVKTYRYGVASWDSVVNQRGAPTVHVLANGEDGEALESGAATLVFTWGQAEEAIWETCRIRLDTMRFMVDVEVLLDP